MRPHGSIIGQLLATFCICAVLIGIAAVAGFVTVADQNAATSRSPTGTRHCSGPTASWRPPSAPPRSRSLFYVETGQRSFLAPLAAARAAFGRDLATLRREATPGVRGLIDEQARLGAQWFALTPRAAAVRPGTPAAGDCLAGRPAWAPRSPGRPPPRSNG